MIYKGWVPTVTGQLSFATIGQSIHPSKCISYNKNDSCVILQRRDLLDILPPFIQSGKLPALIRELIANKLYKISGDFVIVAVAEYQSNSEILGGNLFLLSNKFWKETIKKLMTLHAELSALGFGEDSSIIIDNIKLLLSKNNDAKAIFSLHRTGETRIEFVGADENSETDALVANQFYFYLKDISHTHQHHHPKYDAILELFEVKNDNDQSWVGKVQQSLYRAIIRFKRFRSEKALFSASGILAYTKSFESAICTTHNSPRKYHTEAIEMSLSVAREELQHFDQKRMQSLTFFKTLTFSLLGVLATIILVARNSGETLELKVAPFLLRLTESVVSKPLQATAIIVFISAFAAFFTNKFDPARFGFFRTLLRVTQGFRLRYFVIFNIVLTVILSATFYYLVVEPFMA